MSLFTDIQNIVNHVAQPNTFVLMSKFNSAVYSFDVTVFPLIILDNGFTRSNEIKKNNNIAKDTKIVIMFLKHDDPYNTDEQRESIRSDMEAVADSVAVNIYQLSYIRPGGSQKYKTTPVFNAFAKNLSGVALEINVIENAVTSFCLPEIP